LQPGLGIIDAALYLVGCLSDRGHKLLLLRQVRQTSDCDEASQIIADALPPLIASHLRWDEYGSLQRELSQLPEPPLRPGFTKADWRGALEVFLLVFGSILPMVIPFTFMSNARMALRISNGIAILLLFFAGYTLGRHTSERPWRVGVAMVMLGVAMVGVAIALGRMKLTLKIAAFLLIALLASQAFAQAPTSSVKEPGTFSPITPISKSLLLPSGTRRLGASSSRNWMP